MKRALLYLLIELTALIILATTVYYGGLWVTSNFDSDFLRVDGCLDAGGAWDYEERTCQTDA